MLQQSRSAQSTFILNIADPNIQITYFQSQNSAVEYALRDAKRPCAYIAMNAEKVVKLMQKPRLFEDVVNPIYYADGASMLWFAKRKAPRIPGVELWLKVLKQLNVMTGTAVVIGATNEVARIAGEKLKSMYQSVEIVFTDGYQGVDIYTKLVKEIKPNAIFVAMGTPRQEEIIARLQSCHSDAFYMGIGGSLDILSGKTKRAPRIFRALQLEFLYRLLIEPKRIFRQRALFIFLYYYLIGRFSINKISFKNDV